MTVVGQSSVDYGHFTIALEPSGYGAGGGSADMVCPLTEGNQLQPIFDFEERPGVPGLGPLDSVPVRARGAGTLMYEWDYLRMSKLMALMAARRETDDDASGNKANYYAPTLAPESARIPQQLGDTTWEYVGVISKGFTLSQAEGRYLEWSIDASARKISGTYAAAASVFAYAHTAPVQSNHLTSVVALGETLVGGGSNFVRSLSIEVDHGFDDLFPLGYSGVYPRRKRKPSATVTLELVAAVSEFYDRNSGTPDGVLGDYLLEGATAPITIKWNNGLSTTSERALTFYSPKARVIGDPFTASPGDLNATLRFQLLAGNISSDAMAFPGTTHAAYTNTLFGLAELTDVDASTL